MIYCLDTNVIIMAMRGIESVVTRLKATSPRAIIISEIVRAELAFGCLKSGFVARETARVSAVIAPFELIPFGKEAVRHYAETRYHLEAAGKVIGPNDMLIAATALATGATMVTANVDEFTRVPGLLVENWT